jgi:hypothetical protein
MVLGALLGTLSCGANTAIVELDWAFVDNDGEPIFPGGAILSNRDTCSLTGVDENGTQTYALNVSLVIEDAACVDASGDLGDTGGGTAAEDCEVAREQFDCDRARGAITGLTVSEEAYLMRVEVWARSHGDGEASFLVDTSCIAVPGPRTRRVEAGRITDLAVYQLVAHGIDQDDSVAGGLDLPGCRVLDSSPTP